MMNLSSGEFPERVVIELTPECNLTCGVCPRKFMEQKKGYMPAGLWAKLIKEIAAYSPRSVVIPFWRGESLLHPDFCSLIELAVKKALRIHISTNGVKLSDDQAGLLAKCEFVTFSIHTISGYKSAKKFLNFRKNTHPIIQVSFVEGEGSMADIYASIVSSPSLEGFDSVRVYAQHSKDGVFGSGEKITRGKRVFCPKLNDTLVIAYDGTVSRCNHIWDTERSLCAQDMSIREIWNSDHFKKIRDGYPDLKCRPCVQWTGHTRGESWQNENGKLIHKRYGA